MPHRADSADYRALLLADTPMLDLRAPVEFARGAFPTAVSLPLMNDEERAAVGTCYKQQGQADAVALGSRLVSGPVREQRLAAWRDFALAHPEGYLYCFRGGMRSAIVQRWLAEAGVDYPRVEGGYKALRGYLLGVLPQLLQRLPIRLVCGRTGSGKTRAVQDLPRSVDLEGLAGHRGSAFGQLPAGQPAQIDFENALIIDLLKLEDAGHGPVHLEDEGHMIGSINLPPVLREAMAVAPMLLIEEPLAARVEVVLEDYIVDLGQRYSARWGAEDGPRQHRDKLLDDLSRIRRRLGGERHAAVQEMMRAAFDHQWQRGDIAAHRAWIEVLLADYYDPMYDYQLGKRGGEILFRGSRAEVVAWAGDR